MKSLENDTSNFFKKITSIGRRLTVLPKKKPLTIINCGNAFVSGEHGIFIKNGENKRLILKIISNKFSLTKSNNCKTKTFFSKSFHFEDFDKKDIKFNVESIHGVVENFLRIRF